MIILFKFLIFLTKYRIGFFIMVYFCIFLNENLYSIEINLFIANFKANILTLICCYLY